MLTIREFQIINKLLPMRNAIRIKDLSEEFNVSTRTIQYDLENIRYFFDKYNVDFRTQSNKGIWIEADEEERLELAQLLSKIQRDNLLYDQHTRVERILFYLFTQKNYVTAYDLSEFFRVSRNTIINDFDYMEDLLVDTGIVIIRKQRVGYKIDGEEKYIRAYLESLIQKSMSVYDIYYMLEKIRTDNKEIKLFLPFPDVFIKYYNKIEPIIIDEYKKIREELDGNSNLLNIVLRLLIAIVRLELGFVYGGFNLLKEDGNILFPLYKRICNELELPVLKDEFTYIIGELETSSKDIDLLGLTKNIINYVSEKENFPYDEDTKLFSNLLAHITLSFNDPNANNINNPFIDIIRNDYTDLYNSVKEACVKYIGDNPLITNDSFVSFLVLHFILVYKEFERSNKKVRGVFVCSTGRGAAKLIRSQIENEIKEIEVVKHCSLSETEEVIEKYKPDLIISVFPIKADVPVVIVEPMPSKSDIDEINRVVEEIIKISFETLEKNESNIFSSSEYYLKDEEDISEKIIILGLNIYDKLVNQEKFKIKDSLDTAFLSHIMLMAHRIYFDKQYDKSNLQTINSELEKRVEKIFLDMDIEITKGETIALIQYLAIKLV